MSRIANYQTDWHEVNATVNTSYREGRWVATRALIDLTSSGGVVIRLAIDVSADYYEFKNP
jgi:hypothetical protein